LVGELSTYDCPREPGGKVRHMASLHTSVGQLLKPILEPRVTVIDRAAFVLRGLEELQTERGLEYRLQEWIVTDARDAQTGRTDT